MQKDTSQHLRNCEKCLKFKVKPKRTELLSIKAKYLLGLVHMDYLTTESEKKWQRHEYSGDHRSFTRYAWTFRTPKQSANITAKTIVDKFTVHYGFPEKILLDQGRNFESDLIQEP